MLLSKKKGLCKETASSSDIPMTYKKPRKSGGIVRYY